MIVYRVRILSLDGDRIGKEWCCKLFYNESDAEKCIQDYIKKSNHRSPAFPFKKEQETVDRVTGYCNWQFSEMVTLDSLEIK